LAAPPTPLDHPDPYSSSLPIEDKQIDTICLNLYGK
jgi:hypothetical protein